VASKDEKDWRDRRREQDLHDYWKVPPYWGLVSSKSSRLGAAYLDHAGCRDHQLVAETAVTRRR
jgi:hypothetical protein